MKNLVSLIILDGWGYREEKNDNAIAQAKKPFFDYLWQNYPHLLLKASGEAVGLPEGQMGNSEVGHMTIGAGRIFDTDLVKINKAIQSGTFRNNVAFLEAFKHAKENDSCLHLMGLLSDIGVHGHMDHLFELIQFASDFGLKKVAIHAFTDGRDTEVEKSEIYLKRLEEFLKKVGIGSIASISGRYFAMDRDNNWDRIQKVVDVMFNGLGRICENNLISFVESLHKKGETDEFIIPTLVQKENSFISIKENDSIIFYNFRSDRTRQLSKKILEKKKEMNLCFVSMTEYEKDFDALVAFQQDRAETNLAEIISSYNLKQSHIAETEKFAHVTFFFNGGNERVYPLEKDILIKSDKDVATYDLAPKMQALEIAEKAKEEIESGTNFLLVNIANPDMLGHTANVPAIIEAIQKVDEALKIIVEAVLAKDGVAIVTADHGNAEINICADGSPHTAHTANPVPCIIVDNSHRSDLWEPTGRTCGRAPSLIDLAPTVLKYFDIEKPKSMTGESLIN